MQVELNPIQTKLVLRTIKKLLQLSTMDQNSKTYPKKCNAFLSQFSEQEFNQLESFLSIFEQSRGVTFCL